MEEEKEMITASNFFLLLGIYNSKEIKIDKKRFCNLIGISEDNSITYKRVMDILKHFEIISTIPNPYSVRQNYILIDRKKLERLILSLFYYKKIDEFIHKCMFGALTP